MSFKINKKQFADAFLTFACSAISDPIIGIYSTVKDSNESYHPTIRTHLVGYLNKCWVDFNTGVNNNTMELLKIISQHGEIHHKSCVCNFVSTFTLRKFDQIIESIRITDDVVKDIDVLRNYVVEQVLMVLETHRRELMKKCYRCNSLRCVSSTIKTCSTT